MTLNQALKVKNRLAGELKRLKDIFARENSRESSSTSTVDRAALATNMFATMDQLVLVKAKIAAANMNIYEKIEYMKELKGMIAYLKELNTTDGVIENPTYGTQTNRLVYSAHFKQSQIDDMTRELQNKIENLQDQIDSYNATTEITL